MPITAQRSPKATRETEILSFFLGCIRSLAADCFRGCRRFGRCGGFCGTRGSGPSKADARLIAIGELDTGCLECSLLHRDEYPIEVIVCRLTDDDLHARRCAKRSRTSPSVRNFGFGSVSRRFTPATCSSVSRYGLVSCCSISLNMRAAPSCRLCGQVKTRSSTFST